MNKMQKITAVAHSNIALIKYWGKSNQKLNIPAVDSISITLKKLSTKTSVMFSENFKQDILILNNKSADEKRRLRVSHFLDLIRNEKKINSPAEVKSENNFPTSAGLASSASGFAALALAASKAVGLNLSPVELSELARKGSGSAARSIFGGFVHMHRGNDKSGIDSVAEPLYDENYWDLHLLILVTSTKEKDIGSTEGMNLTAKTSPYYKNWIQSSLSDISEMKNAIAKKDFEKVGDLSEFSCLKMHALAMSANPGIIYWNENTIKIINKVRALRQSGLGIFFTIDAGPQVKVLCLPKDVKKIKNEFQPMKGIKQIIQTAIGPSAYILGDKS
jgi:diphosphomevalonate decarboxylase